MVGTGFSDDVSHILVWGHVMVDSRSLVHVMTRGLEMCVLEVAKVWLIDGSGCECFAGVHYTGFVDGDLVMGSIPRSTHW